MTSMPDAALQALIDQVNDAAARRAPLQIAGGGTKAFYGNPVQGEPLDTRALAGIGSYEPTELVVTARAGTPLAEVEATLAERGQFLAFEPPRFGAGGTVGGMVAAGLSGPSRAAAGALRDHVLGAVLLNGRAEVLRFGGQVMKNVAGYDVSRLLAGSLGTLGVILEVSLKVLPRPLAEATLCIEAGEADALQQLNHWGGRPLPLNASLWLDGRLWLRLSGAQAAVRAAAAALGGETVAEADTPWTALRDHRHPWFEAARQAVAAGRASLWRLSLPSVAPPLALPGDSLIEWGGAQRWLLSDAPVAQVRAQVRAAGGHATLFHAGSHGRNTDNNGDAAATPAFEPLAAPLARIQRQLMAAFDPLGLFNRGRLHPAASEDIPA